MLTLKRRLLEAFESSTGSDDVPASVVRSLDDETRELIVQEYVNAFHRRITRYSADPRQFWLDLGLPQFSHISVQNGNSLEEYRAATERLATRIKSYGYARCSDARLKRDQKELRERMRLDPKIAPYFANDPNMTTDRAIELYRDSLHTPRARRNQRQAAKAIRARWDRTENQ